MIPGPVGLSRGIIMKNKYSLVSISYKILSYWMMSFVMFLTITVIIHGGWKNIGADLFIAFLLVFVGYGTFEIHYARIIVKTNRKIVFYVFHWFKPKKYVFSLDDIKELVLDSNIGDINVISLITKDETIKFTGYNSLRGIKNNLLKSKQIVECINKAKYLGSLKK